MLHLIPKQKIGGLEISQTRLCYSYLLNKKSKRIAKIELGCLDCFLNGEIQNQKNLKKSLSELNLSIKEKFKLKKKELIKVALTIPAINFFTYSFQLPLVEKKELKEAIFLNLKLNSPQDFEKVYADWQTQKVDQKNKKVTIFAAYAPKETINQLETILKDTGFLPVAIEFFSLSLTRAVNYFYPSKFYDWIFVYLTKEGIEVSIINNKKIYLCVCQEWHENFNLNKKNEIVNFLETTLFHITTFWKSHFKKELPENVFINGEISKDYLTEIIQKIKKDIPKSFSLSFIAPSQGAAIRKLLGIYQQKEITLISSGSLKLSEQEFKKTFFSLWQKILLAGVMIGIITFSVMRIYLNLTNNSLKKNLATQQEKNATQIQLSKKLQKESKEFNSLISSIIKIQNKVYFPDRFFKTIKELSDNNKIKILEITPFKEKIFKFKGVAPSTQAIIKFSQDLKKNKNFSRVDLSPKSIQEIEKKFVFELTFFYQKEK